MEKANPYFSATAGVLFDKKKTKLLRFPPTSPETSYSVPNGVTVIGKHAFQNARKLREIILPDTLISIEDSAFDEKEFDLEFASIDKNIIDDICAEYIEKDNTELERENAMLNDAYYARRNARTVKDFQEFSDLIDELQADIDSYCEYAKLYSSYINNLSMVHDDQTETSYILLTLSE